MFFNCIYVFECNIAGMKGLLILFAGVTVVFWNVENFFAPGQGPHAELWTVARMRRKCEGVAKTLLLLASETDGLPDAIGFAEVGDRSVMEKLLYGTALGRADYTIVHYDSPDRRGIDCALLYRRSRLKLLYSQPAVIMDGADTVRTRDILLAKFVAELSGDTLAILVNHHPSKLGGAEAGHRRELAMQTMLGICDTLPCPAVCIGDFNDKAGSLGIGPLTELEPDSFSNPDSHAAGTARYNGEWVLIDRCMVSAGLERSRMTVFDHPSLLQKENAHGGMKPVRTFIGPRYAGGLSDHLPVYVVVH